MNKKIKATGINLNPEIEIYLDERLQTIDKMVGSSGQNILCEIELGKTTAHHQTGDIFRAEINLSVGGDQFRAEAESSDLNSAIDKMKDEIANALRSFKGKRQSLVKRGGARIKELLREFYK